MRAIINGVEGGRVGLYKGGAATLKVRLLGDDGTTVDITDAVGLTALVYDTKDRRNAATFSKALTPGTLTAGVATLVLLASDMVFGPSVNNVPYYLFIKFTDVGNVDSVGLLPTEVIIK